MRLEWHGEKVSKDTLNRARAGVGIALEVVLQRSNQIVPIEEATLERSGAVDLDEREPRGTVSYDTPYAAVQHEALDFRHDEGREAKFLEKALNRSAGDVQKIIGEAIGRGL